MNAKRVIDRYEFCRTEHQGEEWEALKADGWRTLHVNDDGMALMRRDRRWNDATDTDTAI